MNLSLPKEDLLDYILKLMSVYLPDGNRPANHSTKHFDISLQRLDHCFSKIETKYYQNESETTFNHLNGDHMASLLYFYGNTLWNETGDTDTPVRLFYINKIMHGLDLFYSVKMPNIFKLIHPVGTVLGNAHYNDYFVAYQNCTVGADTTVYPKLGEETLLYSGSSVIGDCTLGDNVVVAAKTLIINMNIPSNSIVTGRYPNNKIHKNRKSVKLRQFGYEYGMSGT